MLGNTDLIFFILLCISPFGLQASKPELSLRDSGILAKSKKQFNKKLKNVDNKWNFGPKKNNFVKVKDLVKKISKLENIKKIKYSRSRFYETAKLMLNSKKAKKYLNWESKLKIDDIDLYEVNEAFAPVPLSWAIELKADMAKLNVNGGAMALGHPLGATGAKLMTTLLHELERTSGKYGLQAICEGGGTANATIIERI